MDIWGKSLAGKSKYKGLRQEQWSRNYKKGSVAEAEKAGNRMMGNEARQVIRSCTVESC